MKLPKKFKINWVNLGPYLTAFFVPMIVMLIVCAERGIWPFGDRCFLRTDLYHQYAPFFKELNYKLRTGGSLFYSWDIGGGTNFWSLAAYYLASPTNLLVSLCPEEYIIEFVTGTIFNKIAICSVTMAYYLNKKHGKSGVEGYAAAFIGIFYSLSGYMAAYNWNVMWLDCLFLFPLVILGVERLALENKGLVYAITLGLSILTNYYIAIMTCGGVIVYCLFLVAVDKRFYKQFGIKFLKFVGYTLLAIALSGVFLIPYIKYFDMTASADSTFKWEWNSYFSVFKMLARHLINVEVHTGLEHWPNIYSGMAVFFLIPFYYLNRKVTLREKIGYTVLIIFFYFSFSTRAMDYIWHVFHIPNSLPCRQAYIYIFLLLTMAYRGFMGIKERSYRDITFAMIFALIFIFVVEELNPDTKVYTQYVIYISAVFVILYAILFYIKRRGKLYRDVIIVLFIALAAVDVCVDTSVTSFPTVGRDDYTSYDEAVSEAMDIIREDEGENSFYRVEKAEIRTKNDGAWLNYPSISLFSSTANANLTAFYKKLGMESSFNAYGSVGQTMVTNMLLSVKYTISHRELHPDEELYTLVSTNNKDIWVYKNNYTLPVGVCYEADAAENWDSSGTNPVTNLNKLCEEVSGISYFFTDANFSYTSSANLSIDVQRSGYYYAYVPKSGVKDILVQHDNYTRWFHNLNRGYIMDLGYIEAGDTLTVQNKEEESTRSITITFYRMKDELMEDLYNAFMQYPYIVDKFTDTEISGHVTAPANGGYLITSIADEGGWEVYVDGKKAEKTLAQESYIQVYLTPGEHEVTFKFHVELFGIGLACTLGAIAILVLIFVLTKLKEQKARAKVDRFIESYSGSLDIAHETLYDLPEEKPEVRVADPADTGPETFPEVPFEPLNEPSLPNAPEPPEENHPEADPEKPKDT